MTMDKLEGEAVIEVERLSKLGTARFQQGHKKKALEAYRNAHKASQALGQFGYIQRACAFNLGAMLISYGNFSEGLLYLNQAVPPEGKCDGRSNGDLFFNYGLAHEGLENWSESVQYFRKALKEYESEESNMKMETDTIQRLAKLSKEAGFFQEADTWLQQLTAAYNKSGEREKSLQTQAEHARLLLEKLGRADVAEVVADQCFESVEKCPSSKVLGYVLVELVLVYTQTHNYAKGIQCCEQALSLHGMIQAEPKLAAVVFQNLGAIYNHMKQYESAVEFHAKAAEKHAVLKDRRSQGHCFMNMGYAYSQIGDMGKAGDFFLHALQAAKDCGDRKTEWQSLESLGAVAYNDKAFNRAQTYYRDALTAFAQSPEAASVETQERILSKLKEIIQQQIPKAPQKIDGSNFAGKGSHVSEGEGSSSEEEKENEKVDSPGTKVEGRVFAVRRNSGGVKYLRVRRSGTLKRFKKVALGLDDELTNTGGSHHPEVFRLFKADVKGKIPSGDEESLIGANDPEDIDDEELENGPNVVELRDGNRKRYVKIRKSGSLRKFKAHGSGAKNGEEERIYEVLESDGELDPEDGLTSQEDEDKDDEEDVESTKIRHQRPPDSYVKSPGRKVLSDTMSGSEEVEEVGDDNSDDDSEKEEQKKMRAAMAKFKDATTLKEVEADVHVQARRGDGDSSSEREEETSEESESDDDEDATERRRGKAPTLPSRPPPDTGEVRTYERPLNNSEKIYETIDHKPPSGRGRDGDHVHFKEKNDSPSLTPSRAPTRRGRNTPGAEDGSEDEIVDEAKDDGDDSEETPELSRGQSDMLQYEQFKSDMEGKRLRNQDEQEKGDQKSSKHCIVM
ncbi:uncharacterized protein LOC101852699 isoform X2 [Aplysia californica]|uniref:Uncharacterized protein LOC101852699 isoform X2 n=1 Tax=Aplysia californica TaxID=6500 RepID=A0ABM0JSD6_APLCA|nr:uncharacterized protein LOC101852699 isoform X2 [Aplysia californica]